MIGQRISDDPILAELYARLKMARKGLVTDEFVIEQLIHDRVAELSVRRRMERAARDGDFDEYRRLGRRPALTDPGVTFV